MNFIPLFSSGGIGDLIISLSWIENVIKPLNIPVKFYSNFPEIASYFMPWLSLSKDLYAGGKEKRSFDYFIEISDMVLFEIITKKELPSYIKELYKTYIPHREEWKDYIKYHPFKANEMSKKALSMGLKRWSLPFHFLDKEYKEFEFKNKIGPITIPKRYITIHDGFDSIGYSKLESSTKSWGLDYWEKFIKEFKEIYPEISVIQLGGVKHRKIKGVDINLAGLLSFDKSLKYLKSSLIHVDSDSGLVHARNLFKKPSIVIFGPTDSNYFGYYDNINISPKFCGDCWWLNNTWMSKCMKNFDTPKCMDSTKPQHILRIVQEYIFKNDELNSL